MSFTNYNASVVAMTAGRICSNFTTGGRRQSEGPRSKGGRVVCRCFTRQR